MMTSSSSSSLPFSQQAKGAEAPKVSSNIFFGVDALVKCLDDMFQIAYNKSLPSARLKEKLKQELLQQANQHLLNTSTTLMDKNSIPGIKTTNPMSMNLMKRNKNQNSANLKLNNTTTKNNDQKITTSNNKSSNTLSMPDQEMGSASTNNNTANNISTSSTFGAENTNNNGQSSMFESTTDYEEDDGNTLEASALHSSMIANSLSSFDNVVKLFNKKSNNKKCANIWISNTETWCVTLETRRINFDQLVKLLEKWSGRHVAACVIKTPIKHHEWHAVSAFAHEWEEKPTTDDSVVIISGRNDQTTQYLSPHVKYPSICSSGGSSTTTGLNKTRSTGTVYGGGNLAYEASQYHGCDICGDQSCLLKKRPVFDVTRLNCREICITIPTLHWIERNGKRDYNNLEKAKRFERFVETLEQICRPNTIEQIANQVNHSLPQPRPDYNPLDLDDDFTDLYLSKQDLLRVKVTYSNGTYIGEVNRRGFRHGTGIFLDLHGYLYQGSWRSDRMHGKGTRSHPDGTKYTGEWREGLRHGGGAFKSIVDGRIDIYQGEFEHDAFSEGELKLGNNEGCYNGQFARSGKFHGAGDYKDAKSHYIGQWYDGMKSGWGKEEFQDGAAFTGRYSNDTFLDGEFRLSTGNTYEGEFVGGMCHGRGKFSWCNANSSCKEYIGSFRKGQRTGEGRLIFRSGEVYAGHFRDGKLHGTVEKYDPSRPWEVLRGKFFNGKRLKSLNPSSFNDSSSTSYMKYSMMMQPPKLRNNKLINNNINKKRATTTQINYSSKPQTMLSTNLKVVGKHTTRPQQSSTLINSATINQNAKPPVNKVIICKSTLPAASFPSSSSTATTASLTSSSSTTANLVVAASSQSDHASSNNFTTNTKNEELATSTEADNDVIMEPIESDTITMELPAQDNDVTMEPVDENHQEEIIQEENVTFSTNQEIIQDENTSSTNQDVETYTTTDAATDEDHINPVNNVTVGDSSSSSSLCEIIEPVVVTTQEEETNTEITEEENYNTAPLTAVENINTAENIIVEEAGDVENNTLVENGDTVDYTEEVEAVVDFGDEEGPHHHNLDVVQSTSAEANLDLVVDTTTANHNDNLVEDSQNDSTSNLQADEELINDGTLENYSSETNITVKEEVNVIATDEGHEVDAPSIEVVANLDADINTVESIANNLADNTAEIIIPASNEIISGTTKSTSSSSSRGELRRKMSIGSSCDEQPPSKRNKNE